jgi:uncharacterized NAD(P)/FAD-binding protein YdhS
MADKRRIEGAKERPDQGDVSHRWRIHPAVDKELDELGDEDAVSIHASVVAEIESSKAAVRYSTLDRYAEAVTKHKKRLDLTPA